MDGGQGQDKENVTYREPRVCYNFSSRESQLGIRLKHESDQVLGQLTGVVPVRRCELEITRENRLE